MKKVCIVTAARSEYGVLRWIIDEFQENPEVELQLIVTGSHLSPEQGMTVERIEEDGYTITKKIEFLVSTHTDTGIAKSIGLCAISFADALSELRPDILVVLGDRYELLPICSVALVLNIPIAHISGGDITEGAIDDQVRNAITMMSTLHFPGNEDSRKNIVRMLGKDSNIYNVGEPGLDNFKKMTLLTRTELAKSLNLNPDSKWVLMTLHSETKKSISYSLDMAKNLVEVLLSHDIEIICSGSNADLGGYEINAYLKQIAFHNPNFHYVASLGQLSYISVMNEVVAVVGNSSSGIIEAPFVGTPVLNLGNRQKGRHICLNVLNIEESNKGKIDTAIDALLNKQKTPDFYYGDGFASHKIVNQIMVYLKKLI